jgi:hypothetical protein
MRRAVILLSIALWASGALAAPAPRIPPRPPAPASPPIPPTPPVPLPPQTPVMPTLSSGGLPPPSQSGDPRPQCRAECAKQRYQCSPDDEGCTDRWTQCLAACAR